MTNEYVLATNDDGELAVRTVNATESSSVTSTNDIITRTEDGKLAVRVVGAGGGDSHNKGYFANQAALEEAYPTGEAGDYAVVGDTDTIWIWDTDDSAWVDSDTKGQVTSVNNQTGAVTIGANDILPSQTGNSGKFLTTDGTDASWSDKPLVNQSTGTDSIGIGSAVSQNYAIAIGPQVTINKTMGIGIGWFAKTRASSIAIGINAGSSSSATGDYSISIGGYAKAGANNTIQFNASNGHTYTNSDANTFKVGNANGNFEIMSADGTIPEARLADTTNAAQGQVLTLDSNLNAVWQAGGGGSSYTAGTGIDITNDTISVSPTSYSPSGYKVRQLVLYGDSEVDVYSNSTAYSVSQGFQAGYGYVNISSNTNAPSGGVVIGDKATSNGSTGQILIGERASSTAAFSIAIGSKASVTAQGAIQLGDAGATKTNSDANTFKVGNANGNYELMSADGTVPTARLTKVNTTATLAVADWSSSTQTVTVSGVKADSVVFVSPAPASANDYASAGILCTAQAADSLTFTCTTTPSNAITVNVVCM